MRHSKMYTNPFPNLTSNHLDFLPVDILILPQYANRSLNTTLSPHLKSNHIDFPVNILILPQYATRSLHTTLSPVPTP